MKVKELISLSKVWSAILLPLICLSSLALAQWPRFHGNSLNTGVVPGAQGRSGTYIELWLFHVTSYASSSPALADLDGDGLLEVVIGTKEEALYALNGEDGSILWSYPLPETDNDSSPIINDLDSDGKPEVVFATLDTLIALQGESGIIIWSQPIDGSFAMSPCTADLDGDGTPEVIFTGGDRTSAFDGETGAVLWTAEGYCAPSYSSSVAEDTDLDGSAEVLAYFWDPDANICLLDGADGSLIWSTPIPAPWIQTSAAAFADLDLNGFPEIVSCSGDNDLYVMSAADGSIQWSIELPGYGYSSPCLMDINGNDSLEIVVGLDESKELRAYTCTGDSIWTASVAYWPRGTPAVADIDGDQTLEIIQSSVWAYGAVQIFDAATGTLEWGQDFTSAIVSSPAIGDLDGDGFYDFVFGGTDGFIYAMTTDPQGITPQSSTIPLINFIISPNPFSSSTYIVFELSEPGYTSIQVFDLSGRMVCSLAESELGSGQHSYIWDGTNQYGEPVSSGVYICRIQSGGISETISMCVLR